MSPFSPICKAPGPERAPAGGLMYFVLKSKNVYANHKMLCYSFSSLLTDGAGWAIIKSVLPQKAWGRTPPSVEVPQE